MNHPVIAAALAGVVFALSSLTARAALADSTSGPVTNSANGSAAAEEDHPAKAAERSDDENEAFRLGAIAGVGFPRPLAIEGMVKVGGVLALGVEYSVFPKTSISGVEATSWAIAGDARLFPFKRGFFIGMRAGHQVLTAKTTLDAGQLGTYDESARAETWFVNPRLGFLWTWESGFTLGIDAGVQIPINPTLTTSLPDALPSQFNGTIASVAGAFGNNVTPTVDLLRIGFLF